MKTVSLVSSQVIAKVPRLRRGFGGQGTAKNSTNPEGKPMASYGAGKTEIEQSLARSQSMLRALHAFRTAIWQIPGNISPFKIVNYW